VSADEKAAVEQPLADLKTSLAGTDIESIKSATEKLMAASQAFSQKLYEAAARDTNAEGTSATGQASGQSGAPNDDDIVDAEIVDEK
jgi:molecular chaperone DnaK